MGNANDANDRRMSNERQRMVGKFRKKKCEWERLKMHFFNFPVSSEDSQFDRSAKRDEY